MRYFLFNYGYYHIGDGSASSGGVLIESSFFPAEREIRRLAVKQSQVMGSPCRVSVTGWTEFDNQQDYNNFCEFKQK